MSLGHAFSTVITDGVDKVRAINRRYAQPRLAMSPNVRLALLCLRLYLLVLVGLLGYKFISVVLQ
jgi:hypothetical protein